MDMSAEAGTRRRSPQLMLGWAALALLVAGVALSFPWQPVGFAVIGVGAIALFVAFGFEMRTRKAVVEAGPAFAEGGTFGGRRSPQTHTRM